MSTKRLISAVDVALMLHDIIDDLAQSTEELNLYIVGGAAMSLLNDERQATTDIDCWLRERSLSEVGLDRFTFKWGFSSELFDEGVSQFIPTLLNPAETFNHLESRGRVHVHVAKPEILLAMKLKASRLKDQNDISFLVKHLGIRTLEEAEALVEYCFPGDALTDKAIMRLELAFDELGDRG